MKNDLSHLDRYLQEKGADGAAYRLPGLTVVASWGSGWEHVSVSRPSRCPTWEEMCLVKDMFWDEEECVVEYHPPKSKYVDNHPYCLHMWKPIGVEVPLPPSILVGLKGLKAGGTGRGQACR
ncbi:MAG: hypothetical protein FWH40_04810 [Coriobacteriia bacterium]|nr:hypothetical protein [Coriobacteriia bacterium]